MGQKAADVQTSSMEKKIVNKINWGYPWISMDTYAPSFCQKIKHWLASPLS